MTRQYWLMKSEPAVYPWSQLIKERRTGWNGVRNYQANNNMKAMRLDDEAFFYHSNEQRSIVGIVKVVGLWHPDPEDESGRFGMVDVAPVRELKNPVSLATLKAHPLLSEMIFVRQGRLSVAPVTPEEWCEIIKLSDSE
jgi:predicted RNA-binding protein with PUA-like domain